MSGGLRRAGMPGCRIVHVAGGDMRLSVEPVAEHRARCTSHTVSANGHRVLKRHPDGKSIKLGGSPVIGSTSMRRADPSTAASPEALSCKDAAGG